MYFSHDDQRTSYSQLQQLPGLTIRSLPFGSYTKVGTLRSRLEKIKKDLKSQRSDVENVQQSRKHAAKRRAEDLSEVEIRSEASNNNLLRKKKRKLNNNNQCAIKFESALFLNYFQIFSMEFYYFDAI